jgi:hypothetical protein
MRLEYETALSRACVKNAWSFQLHILSVMESDSDNVRWIPEHTCCSGRWLKTQRFWPVLRMCAVTVADATLVVRRMCMILFSRSTRMAGRLLRMKTPFPSTSFPVICAIIRPCMEFQTASVNGKFYLALAQSCEKQLLPSPCLLACNNLAHAGRIFVKFSIGDFF